MYKNLESCGASADMEVRKRPILDALAERADSKQDDLLALCQRLEHVADRVLGADQAVNHVEPTPDPSSSVESITAMLDAIDMRIARLSHVTERLEAL